MSKQFFVIDLHAYFLRFPHSGKADFFGARFNKEFWTLGKTR